MKKIVIKKEDYKCIAEDFEKYMGIGVAVSEQYYRLIEFDNARWFYFTVCKYSGAFYFGVSVSNPKDKFNKSTGRFISMIRCLYAFNPCESYRKIMEKYDIKQEPFKNYKKWLKGSIPDKLHERIYRYYFKNDVMKTLKD